MFRLNPGPVAAGKESFQPKVPESDNRHTVKYNPWRYWLQCGTLLLTGGWSRSAANGSWGRFSRSVVKVPRTG